MDPSRRSLGDVLENLFDVMHHRLDYARLRQRHEPKGSLAVGDSATGIAE